MERIPLTHVVGVVAKCFKDAEKCVRRLVKQVLPNAKEEDLTTLLTVEFHKALKSATRKKLIEQAFMDDVQAIFPNAYSSTLEQSSMGLIARVIWHNNSAERRSGGDFGLIWNSPVLTRDEFGFTINDSITRGVLIQAKKRKPQGKWNGLTKNQKKEYPSFSQHGLLLLYRFTEPNKLKSYKWHNCYQLPLQTLEGLFKEDRFPKGLSTNAFFEQLESGVIGTTDSQTISDKIAPGNQNAMEIMIEWSDGDPPMSQVQMVTTEVETQITQTLSVAEGRHGL